ncbi:arylsulfatase [Ancylostoma caninum]|uniref:Arylsulfatase n=1 Tax=Ancylostoma caninum TaxID=29170 RepID=A0A368G1T7_ANCCA|nr:arylsulfatase [Ancylostoma caninum]
MRIHLETWMIVTMTLVVCGHGETKKNVILIITDDQDIELGSMTFMPKVLRLMREKGTEFKGGKVHEHRSIGVYLKEAGYRTAYLGKYLNEYEGDYVPPGWDYWMGLVKNSKFYNYTVNFNGDRVKYGADYHKVDMTSHQRACGGDHIFQDYFTDLVTNHSVKFIEDHFLTYGDKPFLLVISYPAPHGPEDPAPQYADLFEDIDSHRTESWNYAPNPDKQWLLQRTGKMEPVHVAFTDLLHRRRMQTLQSVDDGVHQASVLALLGISLQPGNRRAIFSTLRDHNYLSSTYAFYTSDHGYHLGQFGLIKGKNMPYEFDIRVPFFLRGPGVMKNFSIREPVVNVDIAPTLLSIAGSTIPAHMDGRSLLELVALKKAASQGKFDKVKHTVPWRDTVLIERGKMPKLRKIRDRWLNQKERYGKEMRLNEACIEEESQSELIDEFLRSAHEYDILRNKEWHQGYFASPMSRQRRNACSCRGNLHPLKLDEFNIIPNDSLDAPRRKKEKGNATNPDRAACSVQQMNCFLHNTDHWKTPPLWPDQYGQFCFCQNSNK